MRNAGNLKEWKEKMSDIIISILLIVAIICAIFILFILQNMDSNIARFMNEYNKWIRKKERED